MPELSVVEKADITLIPDEIADKAHIQLSLTVECEPTTNNSSANSSTYCFRKANYDEINDQLEQVFSNPDFLFQGNNVNEMVTSIYGILHEIIDAYVPRSTIRIDNKPIWYDKKLTTLKNLRNNEYKKLCRERISNTSADDTKFMRAKREFDEYQTIRYRDHIQTIAANVKNDQKKFWKYVNGKRSGSKLPNKMTFDGQVANNDAEKASLFAKFFSSVYVEHANDIDLNEFLINRNDSGMFKIHITAESVLQVLQTMDMNKGISPDRISPIFLRKCALFLAGPLSYIYSKSMETSCFPDSWKIGKIVPIFKAGSKSKIENYRGVNIMPNLAKVFEKVIYNQLKLIVMPRLSNNQHGFVTNRNIETNLMSFTMKANEAFSRRAQLDVFLADIKKAFDWVNQSKVIRKMAKFPVSNNLLRWLQSYFNDRQQYVSVGNDNSNKFKVPSSVGQGSILGPLLFLIFFDDSDNGLELVNTYNFADDKKIATIVSKPCETINLQKAITKFSEWCDNNDLEMNISKCKIMTFTRKRQPIIQDYFVNGVKIDRVFEHRDLGVIMDPAMKFSLHREHVKRRAMSALFFVIRVCRKKFDLETAKLLYYALVRAIAEFASLIWSPHDKLHINFIESIQRQAVIFLHRDYINRKENNYVLSPYTDRCNELEIATLMRRRLNTTILFMHKIITGRYKAPEIRNAISLNTGIRTFRNPEFIRVPFCRTEDEMFSPFNFSCRAYNFAALYADPTQSFDQFKNSLLQIPDLSFDRLCKL